MKKIITILFVLSCFVSFSQDTKVTAPLGRNNGLDSGYATHIDTLGKGGWMGFTTLANRDSLPFSGRKKNMIAVVGDTMIYMLVGGLSNANWTRVYFGSSGSTIVTPGIDSIIINTDTICIYKLGAATCYELGKYVRYIGLNYDSTKLIYYNIDMAPLDSVLIPHTYVKGGPGVVINHYVGPTGDTALISATGSISDGVLSPGYVTYDTLLTFDVTAGAFIKNGIVYSVDAGSITLPPADATFGRFDVIGWKTDGTIISVQGTPSANPEIPSVDLLDEVYLTAVFIPAGATDLTIPQVIAYDEGVEWDTLATGSATVRFNSTINPHNLIRSIDIGAGAGQTDITLTSPSPVPPSLYNTLTFWAYPKAAFTPLTLQVWFLNGNTQVSSRIMLLNNYGFNRNIVGWQLVTIPLADFNITTTYNKIRFNLTGASYPGMYIDYVRLQAITQGSSNFLTNTFISNDSLYQVKNGVNLFVGMVGSSGSSDSTLQQIIDGSIAADGNVLGNAHGNELNIDSTSEVFIKSYGENGRGYLNLSGSQSSMQNDNDSLEASISTINNYNDKDSIHVKLKSIYVDIDGVSGEEYEQDLEVRPKYSLFTGRNKINEDSAAHVIIAHPDTVSTPDYTFGARETANGQEFVLYPTPSGSVGSGGDADSLVGIPGAQYVLRTELQDTANKRVQSLFKSGDSLAVVENGAVTYLDFSSGVANLNIRNGGGLDTSALGALQVDSSIVLFRNRAVNELALKVSKTDSVSGVATNYVTQYQRKKTSDSLVALIASSGGGTVTTVSDLSPLFTTSTRTTTPTFSLTTAAANTVFGNHTGSTAAPTYGKLPVASISATGTPASNTFLRGDGNWIAGALSPWLYSANNNDIYFPTYKVGIGTTTPSSALTLNTTSTATTFNDTTGIVLANSVTATVGVPTSSPVMEWVGSQWNTATGLAEAVKFRMGLKTLSGSGVIPSLIIQKSTNGGAYSDIFASSSLGYITVPGIISGASFVSTGNISASGQVLLNQGGIFNGNTINQIGMTGAVSLTSGTATYRGVYFDPTLTLTTGLTLIGFQNTKGDNRFNTTSGSTAIGPSIGDVTAKLDVQSTTQGFAPPRMTTIQKNAISSPVEGLIVYDLTLHKLCVYTGSAWETVTSL